MSLSLLPRNHLHRLFRPFRRCPRRNFAAGGFDGNLLRLLRSNISYHSDYCPPLQPPATFGSFSIEDRPGEQWIRLRRRHGLSEEIKIDATMFDGTAMPVPETASIAERVDYIEKGPRLHISLIVEVVKADEGCDSVLEFICSAWPEKLQVQKAFTLRKKGTVVSPYMGRQFRKLDEELQNEMKKYLVEREINDNFAGFLHEYMANKDKAEHLRWLHILESFVQKQSNQ